MLLSKGEERCFPHECSLGIAPVKAGRVSEEEEEEVTPSQQALTSLPSLKVPSSNMSSLQKVFILILLQRGVYWCLWMACVPWRYRASSRQAHTRIKWHCKMCGILDSGWNTPGLLHLARPCQRLKSNVTMLRNLSRDPWQGFKAGFPWHGTGGPCLAGSACAGQGRCFLTVTCAPQAFVVAAPWPRSHWFFHTVHQQQRIFLEYISPEILNSI